MTSFMYLVSPRMACEWQEWSFNFVAFAVFCSPETLLWGRVCVHLLFSFVVCRSLFGVRREACLRDIRQVHKVTWRSVAGGCCGARRCPLASSCRIVVMESCMLFGLWVNVQFCEHMLIREVFQRNCMVLSELFALSLFALQRSWRSFLPLMLLSSITPRVIFTCSVRFRATVVGRFSVDNVRQRWTFCVAFAGLYAVSTAMQLGPSFSQSLRWGN